MSFGRKFDYPPLLPPGRHVMTLAEVKAAFIDSFPASDRRRRLFQKLEEFVQAYLVAGIRCEIWLDGSVLTEKPDPLDMDASVVIENEVNDHLTEAQKELVDRTNAYDFYPDVDCAAYVLLDREHPDYYDEWLNPGRTLHETYGSEHSKEWLKGYVVIKLRETDVGLRICR